jgi:hypothetical protein
LGLESVRLADLEESMGTARKGFDPLSSLFDMPGSGFMDDTTTGNRAIGFPAEAVEEEVQEHEPPVEEIPEEKTPVAEIPEEKTPVEETLYKEALAKSLAAAALARTVEAGESGNAGLAQRAAKPVSALEAARNAAASEARQRQEVQQKQASVLPRQVEKLLSRKLPGVQRLEVVNALVMDDREVLKALWKAHRTRMAQHGVLGMVVAATSVLRALEAVPKGQLVAAVAATESSEYLVWVDIGSEATIAAFPDARTWITRS